MDDLMVWVDVETTGLSPEVDSLLELGVIVTNTKLEILSSDCWLLGLCGDNRLDTLARRAEAYHWDDFIKEMHTKSGLLEDWCTKPLYGEDNIEHAFKEFFERFNFTEKPPMCGNNIPFDRAFLKYHLPDIESQFHYRNLDVSSLKNAYKVEKEFYKNRTGFESDVMPDWVSPEAEHRPIADLEVSIAEYKFYREHLFR